VAHGGWFTFLRSFPRLRLKLPPLSIKPLDAVARPEALKKNGTLIKAGERRSEEGN
jgi:hypothetical protein